MPRNSATRKLATIPPGRLSLSPDEVATALSISRRQMPPTCSRRASW